MITNNYCNYSLILLTENYFIIKYANQYLIPSLKIRVINAMAIFSIVCTRSPDVDLTFIAL